MGNKKINWQKSATSLTTIFLVLIFGFIIMGGSFAFMTAGVEKYGVDLPSVDNQTIEDLKSNQLILENNINNISNSVGNISVQKGVLQTFWNSFVGLGAILQLPFTVVQVAVSNAQIMILGTEIIPFWFNALLQMLIIILIVLAIIAAMTGGNQNI